MARFRRISTIIDANQYLGPIDPPKGVFFDGMSPYVITIHQQRVYLEVGDWIIPEKDGVHYYPCKEDIFVATYEPV